MKGTGDKEGSEKQEARSRGTVYNRIVYQRNIQYAQNCMSPNERIRLWRWLLIESAGALIIQTVRPGAGCAARRVPEYVKAMTPLLACDAAAIQYWVEHHPARKEPLQSLFDL